MFDNWFEIERLSLDIFSHFFHGAYINDVLLILSTIHQNWSIWKSKQRTKCLYPALQQPIQTTFLEAHVQ